jgi:hypothetical protein
VAVCVASLAAAPPLPDSADVGGTERDSRLGDVVLAALAHANGLDPADYGPFRSEEFKGIIPPLFHFGYHTDAEREKGLAKWKRREMNHTR